MAQGGSQKYLFLDGVRGVAALMVTTQHMGLLSSFPLGQAGVDIFFVLSAFLLTKICYEKFATFRKEKRRLKDWSLMMLVYCVRRFMRVYPLFVLVAIVVYALPEDVRAKAFFTKGEQYHLLPVLIFEFSQRFHVFWTLPVEMEYYAVIPFFAGLMVLVGRFWWIPCSLLLAGSIAEGLLVNHHDHQPIYPQFGTFITGSVFAMLTVKLLKLKSENVAVFGSKWFSITMHLLGFVAFAFMLCVLAGDNVAFLQVVRKPFQSLPGNNYIAFNVSFLIFKELLWPSFLSGSMEWNLFTFSGKISYPMYLLHSFPVFLDPYTEYYERVFFGLIGTFALSTAAHYLLEFPLQKLTGIICRRIDSRMTMSKSPQVSQVIGSMQDTPLKKVIVEK